MQRIFTKLIKLIRMTNDLARTNPGAFKAGRPSPVNNWLLNAP